MLVAPPRSITLNGKKLKLQFKTRVIGNVQFSVLYFVDPRLRKWWIIAAASVYWIATAYARYTGTDGRTLATGGFSRLAVPNTFLTTPHRVGRRFKS